MTSSYEAIAQMLPALRAVLAKDLAAAGLSQLEIARTLGVTQPAVSQYLRDIRGKGGAAMAPDVTALSVRIRAEKLAANVITDELYRIASAARGVAGNNR